MLTCRKNNRLETEPLLVELAEKNVEIVNEPTWLRNNLILFVVFLVYNEYGGHMLLRNFGTHPQHGTLSQQEENFPL